ncbi:hypothetical protein NFHSH190041_34440 [Shewanella sp. NFH-SH190041]|uniref:DUF523 domain-containing protein n=1 Tax=Shewanella sp. NFH-SH190041 TaxID=2950245 RepID=UPI0021C2A040|nr:DUF523 domain-containing protein [Shewanella sp. NFH-SH190041]BDM65992.1 hypothetical protein NFHSH190041_34440 [Shewanella sp. NFH-SH190041]
MEKILISRCLLGHPVRYDGGDNRLDLACLALWQSQGRLVPVCPEVEGGLPIPRPPAEQGHGRVMTCDGQDVTAQFRRGATLAVAKVKAQGIRLAILKARSPSCGSGLIYDGSFSRTVIPGDGITAAALKQTGVTVFTELELAQAESLLAALEGRETSGITELDGK